METLFKALSAFVALFISISVSMPEEGVVEIVEGSPQFTFGEVSNFYQESRAAKDLLDPVVKINVVLHLDNTKSIFATGTGFGIMYDKKNKLSYIITNSHICNIQSSLPVPSEFYFERRTKIIDPGSNTFSGILYPIYKDDSKDLCLMVSESHIPSVKLPGENYTVRQLDRVKIVGAPNGVFPIILDSYVSNLLSRSVVNNDDTSRPFLLISEMVFGGQSGSPVFNRNNEVVGVVSMNLNNEFGPIYGTAAVPLEDLREFISKVF
jgi:S1-C subfamily serine protease